jgi:hypothetical protein
MLRACVAGLRRYITMNAEQKAHVKAMHLLRIRQLYDQAILRMACWIPHTNRSAQTEYAGSCKQWRRRADVRN